MAPSLTIVVPAYNEARRLAATLDQIRDHVSARGLDAEVLVVDDGSTDGTGEIARAGLSSGRGRVLATAVNRGKGHAVRCGVLEARGRRVLITDADLSCPISDYDRLTREMDESDLDVIIGSRQRPESRIEIRQHPVRELMGKAFNVAIRALTPLPYRDTQCGFKLVERARTRPIFLQMRIDGFAYDVEFLLLCARAGLRVGETPVTWRNSPDSRVRLLADSARMLVDLVRVAVALRCVDASSLRVAADRAAHTRPPTG